MMLTTEKQLILAESGGLVWKDVGRTVHFPSERGGGPLEQLLFIHGGDTG